MKAEKKHYMLVVDSQGNTAVAEIMSERYNDPIRWVVGRVVHRSGCCEWRVNEGIHIPHSQIRHIVHTKNLEKIACKYIEFFL